MYVTGSVTGALFVRSFDCPVAIELSRRRTWPSLEAAPLHPHQARSPHTGATVVHCTSYALDWAPQPLVVLACGSNPRGSACSPSSLQLIVRYQHFSHFSRTKLEPKVISNTNAVDPNLPCTNCWHQASPRQLRMSAANGWCCLYSSSSTAVSQVACSARSLL